MRIVKPGRTNEVEYLQTCGNCKTVFAFEDVDVQPDRDGPYVICPMCSHHIAPKRDRPQQKPPLSSNDYYYK